MKKECSMATSLKFLITGILIFSSTLIHSQKKIQLNGKVGMGLLKSIRPFENSVFFLNRKNSALSYNLGFTASYKRVEMELGYLQSFATLGRSEHRNFQLNINGIAQEPYVIIYSNRLTTYQSMHMLVNVKLNLGEFHFKVGGGITHNSAVQETRTTYKKTEEGIQKQSRVVDYGVPVRLQPMFRVSNVIGPYEISLTTLYQKSMLDRDKEFENVYSNISISRYLWNERKNEVSKYEHPIRERIISFTPGYKLYFPVGNGMPSAQSLFFEISKPIKMNWEISASIQGFISFNGYTKTETDVEIDADGYPFAVNRNRLDGFTFYKILVSKINKLSNIYSFVYGLGPTLSYYNSTREEAILGVTAHASLYSPLVQYRLEYNQPFGTLPSHLSFGIGVPISIFKKSKKEEKLPVDLDNWTI